MGVSATVNVVVRVGAWRLDTVGYSELGETTRVDGTLTDVTADTRAAGQPIELQYGIQGSSPHARIAQTGIMSWALDNSVKNSHGAQGAYTPGHANQLAGWDLGNEVHLKITYSGTTYWKFSGRLYDITPDAGQYGRQAVLCRAVDWMDEASRAKVRGVAIQTDKRADELIDSLVTTSVTNQPNATDLNTGQSTFAKSFDNLQDAETSVLTALQDCVISELGYLYVKGDTTQGGTLKFEDRHARPKAGLAAATFNNTMGQLQVIRNRDGIINRVYVVVHPRTTDGSVSVLYELTTTNEAPSVPVASTITINCPFKEASINAYRVAAENLVTPVSGTDWIANTAADGSGTNITSDVAVTILSSAANSAELQIVNNHPTATAYLTTLQVRGTAVRDVTETVLSASDTPSQLKYGETDSRIDMKYESTAGEFGNQIAKWILNIYKEPDYSIQDFKISSNKSDYLMTHSLAREPGDKITLTETMTGISATGTGSAEIGYFINGVNMTIRPPATIETRWTLAPGKGQAAWFLDTVGASELGVTTMVGFA